MAIARNVTPTFRHQGLSRAKHNENHLHKGLLMKSRREDTPAAVQDSSARKYSAPFAVARVAGPTSLFRVQDYAE
jgi:hypothetical protein